MKHYFSCLKGDTIKAIFLVCLAVGVVGMSYGSLAMAYGFPLWVPFVLSIFVLAGASEFMFIGIVASGGNPLAAAAAGLLVNARHVPFGVTVRDLVGTRAASFFGCHIMNDESVVFGLSQKTPEQRKAAYWLCGLGVALFWPIGTLIGAGVGKLCFRCLAYWRGKNNGQYDAIYYRYCSFVCGNLFDAPRRRETWQPSGAV